MIRVRMMMVGIVKLPDNLICLGKYCGALLTTRKKSFFFTRQKAFLVNESAENSDLKQGNIS